MILSIGGSQLILEARYSEQSAWLPSSYQGFLLSESSSTGLIKESPDSLRLSISNQLFNHRSINRPVVENSLWTLWFDSNKNYIFTLAEIQPKRWVVMEPQFRSGELFVDQNISGELAFYPLQYLDMILFSNYLANFGDLILHASGVAFHGSGYVFFGASGSGKSTIADALANEPGITILGEDQVILRYRDGQFWVYGTPWHVREDRCSPLGVPLKKLFFLDRSSPQTLLALTAAEGVLKILQTAFIPYYRAEIISCILAKLEILTTSLPLFTLAYQQGSNLMETIVKA